MEAKELRIGNWCRSVKFNINVQCTIEDFYNLCVMSDGATDDPPINEMFEPIPLTKEWLIKFGFTRGDNETFNDSFFIIKIGICLLAINPDNGVVWIHRGVSIFNNPALVPHVHALQNLYFALTGEELEIKK